MDNKSSKKILIFTPLFFPLFGGIEEQCFILGKEFIRKGYEVDILTERAKQTFPVFENMDGLNVYRLDYGGNRNAFAYVKIGIELIKFLLKRKKDYQFLIIRTLTFHAIVIGILKFLKLLRVKTLVTADSGGDEDEIVILSKYKFHKLMIFFINQNDYINSICKDNLAHFKAYKFNEDKLTMIRNGIETSSFNKLSYPQRIKTFLFLGRLLGQKGIRELLEAFKGLTREHPDAKLIIGGDGPEKSWIVNYIKENELNKNIECTGFIDRNHKSDFFKKGDCLVLPSYTEGFPITIIEATLYKRLIIATDVSDLKEIYGDNIIFCKKKNSKDLMFKMKYVIEKHPKPDYSKIIDELDIQTLATKFEELLS